MFQRGDVFNRSFKSLIVINSKIIYFIDKSLGFDCDSTLSQRIDGRKLKNCLKSSRTTANIYWSQENDLIRYHSQISSCIMANKFNKHRPFATVWSQATLLHFKQSFERKMLTCCQILKTFKITSGELMKLHPQNF